jgi:hypothetical protein
MKAAGKPIVSDVAAIGDDPESRGDPYVGSANSASSRPISAASSRTPRNTFLEPLDVPAVAHEYLSEE